MCLQHVELTGQVIRCCSREQLDILLRMTAVGGAARVTPLRLSAVPEPAVLATLGGVAMLASGRRQRARRAQVAKDAGVPSVGIKVRCSDAIEHRARVEARNVDGARTVTGADVDRASTTQADASHRDRHGRA